MTCTLKKLGLALVAIAHISGTNAECLSLKEFISTNATARFVWYPPNDINAFDKALTEYVNGQSNLDEFQAVFRCSGLDKLGGFQKDHGQSVIRFHRSIICADLIASKDNTDECYRQNTKGKRDLDPGMELVKMAAMWVDSLETIVSNSTLCTASPGINREATLQSLRDKCKSAPYNGVKGSCVNGDDNEPGTCGFQRVEDWCKHCKYASDYPDACMTAGVHISSGSTNSIASKTKDLEKQAHQERLYRIAAIVLSIAVGICLIALMILIADFGAENTGLDGVLGMAERVDKTMDFVDCFVSAVGKPRPVIRHFFARRDDEISLQQGDIVTLQMAFDDGWVVGKNLTTGGEGTFPLMCVMDNLPPSMPAQWSVLPESKMASNENVRKPSQAVTRSPQNDSGSMVSNSSYYHSSIGISAMGNMSDQVRRGGLGNVSRMSNLTVAPNITRTNIPSQTSSRSKVAVEGNRENTSIISRLLGAFGRTGATNLEPMSEESGSAVQMFKRLVSAPFGNRETTSTDAGVEKSSHSGRPSSFNVNHVVHVGIDTRQYPRPSDTPRNVSDSRQNVRAGERGYFRQPAIDGREIAEVVRQRTVGNASAETYQTAEQMVHGNN
ncbi:hypothetical protein DL89DRAFT_321544 [Linderina pennispora]|uniref:SH3 domain-containing protein n=1 Tax=Linderina pennispora TaxID=61395 RepID=A0A1Y1WC38_9FUNG|nr:uncharacterized protein DL89DRAFT_321544 [Linderina pennispora]ORX71111.1 hypothetical protein DL89DRAFT_321544 [Linderina pennispora]